MKTNTTTTLLMLTLISAILVAASPLRAESSRNSSDDEQALLEIERQWAGAYLSGNADKLAAIFSNDYIQTNTRASVSYKDEEVAELRAGGFRYDKFDMTDMKVQLYGNAAVVTGNMWVKATDKASGKSLDMQMRVTDTFIRQDGKWQVVASHTTAKPDKTAATSSPPMPDSPKE